MTAEPITPLILNELRQAVAAQAGTTGLTGAEQAAPWLVTLAERITLRALAARATATAAPDDLAEAADEIIRLRNTLPADTRAALALTRADYVLRTHRCSPEPLPEVECPSCGATIRARLADAPDEGGDLAAQDRRAAGSLAAAYRRGYRAGSSDEAGEDANDVIIVVPPDLAAPTAAPGDLAALAPTREHLLSVVSGALRPHTLALAIADDAASDVLDDLSSSSLTVVYRTEPAVEVATPAGEPEWQRVARIAEPYDAAIDLGVPANVTNGKQGARNDLTPAAPAEGETAIAVAGVLGDVLTLLDESTSRGVPSDNIARARIRARWGLTQLAALRDADDPAPWEASERERKDRLDTITRLARAAGCYGIDWSRPDPVGDVEATIRTLRDTDAPQDSDAPAPAPAALAVGDTVTTAEELDARALIRTQVDGGTAILVEPRMWWITGHGAVHTSQLIFPVTVSHLPGGER